MSIRRKFPVRSVTAPAKGPTEFSPIANPESNRISIRRALFQAAYHPLWDRGTIRAFLAFIKGADNTPEGMAKTTAEGRAGVGRQRDRGLAPGRKDESGKVEFFQAAVSLFTTHQSD